MHVRRAEACGRPVDANRSEEHTSELQSRLHFVCRLLPEKKKAFSKTDNSESPPRSTDPARNKASAYFRSIPRRIAWAVAPETALRPTTRSFKEASPSCCR